MFKKTKRKLMIALTIATSSIVLFIMVGIFSSIYISNKSSDKRALEDIMRFHTQSMVREDLPPPKEPNFPKNRDNNNSLRRFYFYFIVDNGEVVSFKRNMPMGIINPNSNTEIQLDIDPQLIYEKVKDDDNGGSVKSNGLSFIYDSKEVENGTMYLFVDTTMTSSFFNTLIKMGLMILLLTIVYILIIGRSIADKILNPLEVSIDLQKRFTGDASHELRTPLTAMRSNLDILINYDIPKEEQETWLNNISNEIDRMTKLTNDLLQLSRNEIIQRECIDFKIEEVYDNICLNYVNICELNMTGGDFLISGTKQEFHQLLIIFIDNAIKYNSKEHKIINIDTKLEKKQYVITISDNGDGIDNDKFDDIFERFYREDKARTGSANGFGLGLSIAKNIINNYEGRVKVESELNKGTTFKLIFPLKKQS